MFAVLTLSATYVHAQQLDSETDFLWEISSDNNSVTITKYVGEHTELRIPHRIHGLPVTVIGDWAFFDKQLTSVVIPDSVTRIGEDAFSVNQLTELVIPSSVTHIGKSAFSSNQLERVHIPHSIVRIEYGTFDTNHLTNIEIPDSITYIGSFAFFRNKLEYVVIPNSVTFIGSTAFAANKLTHIAIPDSVTEIEESAFSANLLTSVEIPHSITYIESGTFSRNKLTSVVIPDSVTGIGTDAFTNNQLTEVVVPRAAKFGISAFDRKVKIKKRRSNGEIYSDEYPVNLNFAYSWLDHRNGIINHYSSSNGDETSYYFSADLFKYNIISADTNIGLFLSPLQYTYIYAPHTQLLSFINAAIYFNLLEEKSGAYDEVENIFGPFFSINWLNMYNYNEFDVKDIIYSAGFLWSWRVFGYDSYNGIKTIKSRTYNINKFTLEVGYKNMRKKDNFYIGVQISDPLIFLSMMSYYIFALFGYSP